jgi:hypothetical protein
MRAVAIVGFLILVGLTTILFSLATFEALRIEPAAGVIMTVTILLMFYMMARDGIHIWRTKMAHTVSREDLKNFISVFGGALITFTLSANLGLGAVTAAGLVAIIAALIVPKYGVPIYCGAFVGMASDQLLCHQGTLAAAGAVAGVVFVLCTGVLDGFGGKLGTIAFTGCISSGLIAGRSFIAIPIPAWDVAWLIILYSVIGAVATFYLSVNLGHGAVMGSGIVGLAGGLILPALHPGIGGNLAVMVICASFAGMSAVRRFPKIAPMFVAGVLCGLFFIYSKPYLGGAGGKLGTIAFGSVIAVRGAMDLWAYMQAIDVRKVFPAFSGPRIGDAE